MTTDLLREELIADMKLVQSLCWTCRITRNYYRAHGKYTESQWHYYFPTFKDFLEAAGIAPDARESPNYSISDLEEINQAILTLSNSKTGDFFAMGAKLYQVTGRNGTAVYTRRYRWYNRLHDWLRG